MTWEAELEEIRRRRELAKEMGGTERVARHVAEGRTPVRDRIDLGGLTRIPTLLAGLLGTAAQAVPLAV